MYLFVIPNTPCMTKKYSRHDSNGISSSVVCVFVYEKTVYKVRSCIGPLMIYIYIYGDGLVVSVSASHAVGRGFASRPGHTKDHHKMVQTASPLGTHGYEWHVRV